MPKKDAKAKAAEKKAAKAARQSKKTEKKEKKVKSKSKDDDGSDEDVDLEAVLAEYAKQVIHQIVPHVTSYHFSIVSIGSCIRIEYYVLKNHWNHALEFDLARYHYFESSTSDTAYPYTARAIPQGH